MTSGVASAASSVHAVSYRHQVRADPFQPRLSTLYAKRLTGASVRSRIVAKSGIIPRYQKTSEIVRYVLIANTSHRSGDLKFTHSGPRELGYGMTQNASHGRPMWINGKSAAHITAKIVIASADRLIAVRHRCRSSRRIAEINVPAWPMPIQNTKLVMSKAHPTVRLRPHTPMPVAISYATMATPIVSAIVDAAKQAHHPAPGRVTSGRITSSVISRSAGSPATGRSDGIDAGTGRSEGMAVELIAAPARREAHSSR